MDKHDQLYSPFSDLLLKFEENFKNKTGISIYLFSGYRSYEEQQKLYDKGRKGVPGEIKVTNCKPGDSWHQYTVAADYAFDIDLDKKGVQWSWDKKFPWDEIGILCKELDLIWGGEFRSLVDKPHIEKTWNLTLSKAKDLYKTGGIDYVWKHLDSITQKVIINVPDDLKKLEPRIEPEIKPNESIQNINIPINSIEDNKTNKTSIFEAIINILKIFMRK